MNTLKPILQSVWRFPAVLNFTLGGIGGALYITGTIFSVVYGLDNGLVLFYKIWSPILVVSGLLMVSIEAGKPSRARYLLKNLRRSWMSKETLSAYIFIPVSVLDIIFQFNFLKVIGLISATTLLLSHGMIIYNARGLPAWNVGIIIPLFVVSALASGSAFFIIGSGITAPVGNHGFVPAFVLTIVSMILWLGYLYHNRDSEFTFSTKILRQTKNMIIIVGCGHIIPAIVLGYLLLSNPSDELAFTELLIIAGGSMVIFGAFIIRNSIIMKAGYFRRITLYNKSSEIPDVGRANTEMTTSPN